MSWIKRFLYGILVGITSIAPGISGGTIAIALGFYESLINAIANIFSDFKKYFSYLFPYGVGAVLSMATLSVILEFLFENVLYSLRRQRATKSRSEQLMSLCSLLPT